MATTINEAERKTSTTITEFVNFKTLWILMIRQEAQSDCRERKAKKVQKLMNIFSPEVSNSRKLIQILEFRTGNSTHPYISYPNQSNDCNQRKYKFLKLHIYTNKLQSISMQQTGIPNSRLAV